MDYARPIPTVYSISQLLTQSPALPWCLVAFAVNDDDSSSSEGVQPSCQLATLLAAGSAPRTDDDSRRSWGSNITLDDYQYDGLTISSATPPSGQRTDARVSPALY